MGFEFATATRIIFGRGKFDAVGEYASGFGNRVFIVNGTHHGIDRALQEVFEEKKINFQFFDNNCEPTVQIVQSGVELANQFSPQFVIGI